MNILAAVLQAIGAALELAGFGVLVWSVTTAYRKVQAERNKMVPPGPESTWDDVRYLRQVIDAALAKSERNELRTSGALVGLGILVTLVGACLAVAAAA